MSVLVDLAARADEMLVQHAGNRDCKYCYEERPVLRVTDRLGPHYCVRIVCAVCHHGLEVVGARSKTPNELGVVPTEETENA